MAYIPGEYNLAVGAGGGRPLAAVDGPQLLAEPARLLVALPAHAVERRDLEHRLVSSHHIITHVPTSNLPKTDHNRPGKKQVAVRTPILSGIPH